MAIEKSGGVSRLQPINSGGTAGASGGIDSVNRAGERQVDAIFSAVGADTSNTVFVGTPGRNRNDLRALGIGRNVDVYV
ncbi:MAG: hypothetical protein ABR584_00630 [Candidatus Baltobacteraceae bacterium]